MAEKCTYCPFEYRIEQVEKGLVSLDKQNSQTHKSLSDALHKASLEYTGFDIKLTTLSSQINEIKSMVVELSSQKGKKWDMLMGFVLSGVVATAINLMFRGG